MKQQSEGNPSLLSFEKRYQENHLNPRLLESLTPRTLSLVRSVDRLPPLMFMKNIYKSSIFMCFDYRSNSERCDIIVLEQDMSTIFI